MASSKRPLVLHFQALVMAIVVMFTNSSSTQATSLLGHESSGRGRQGGRKGEARRLLLSFRETPSGANATFECSPSGPCVPCLYSEKNDEKYRCSETGYRIPLKCVEIEDGSKEADNKKSEKSRSVLENSYGSKKAHEILKDAEELTNSIIHRRLLDDSSTLEDGKHAYITYRSCIPPVNEERLSVLGFEGIMLCLLLVSGSVAYFRRKGTVAMSGVGMPGMSTGTHQDIIDDAAVELEISPRVCRGARMVHSFGYRPLTPDPLQSYILAYAGTIDYPVWEGIGDENLQAFISLYCA